MKNMGGINYRLGLDLGITSVGWSVINLDKNRIEDLGVRIFNAAENPKDGSSLALPRRLARGRRRLVRRKAYRVNRVRSLILNHRILTKQELDELYNNSNNDIWGIRANALDNLIDEKEFSKVLINLSKRRGFKSNRKNEEKDKETGKVITSIRNNIDLMNKRNARTVGEFIYKEVIDSKDVSKSYRNKEGKYTNCANRKMIEDEIKLIFETQRNLGSKIATEDLEKEYLEIFNSQRPYSKFEDLEKMVGYCTFEKDNKEKRAPKNSISAEEFVLFDNINRLSIVNKGQKRKLNEEERNLVVSESLKKKEIKYTALRKLLNLQADEKFSALSYSLKTDIKKTENARFVALKGYHEIKKSIEDNISKNKWNEIKENKELLNDIAYVLSIAKTDDDIRKQMRNRNIDDEIIEATLELSFSKFMNLSIKAINKILPHIKEGYQYNEACEKAGYDFKAIYKGEKSFKLPLIEIDEIVNPVVSRALTQTRKVVNAVIDLYGSPIGINIELSRELAKNFKDRKEIEREQKENRINKERLKKELKEQIGREPNGVEVLKYRLYREQKCECAYTQEPISINDLFKAGLYEIDHIIPYSRSFDDRLNNKILVKATENQRKANKTPYEYFGWDKERWHKFEVWVESSNFKGKKKLNLLKRKFGKEEEREFKERNLQDTKYITKYMANFIRNRLIFKENKKFSKEQKVITVNGMATSYLRAKWGLIKNRDEGDKHHALDATVVAVTTQGMVQEISKYNKAKELKYIRTNDRFIDVTTGKEVIREEYEYLLKDRLPKPWKRFSEELEMRLSENPKEELNKYPMETYDEKFIEETVKEIFVSRVPFRKIGGRLFKETIYSKKQFKDNKFISKVKLIDLKEKDLKNIYNYNTDKKLYDAIVNEFNKNDKNAKKAFIEGFRKPTKSGNIGPIVKSIKIVQNKINVVDGIDVKINDKVIGYKKREGMIRIDLFKKNKKYYCVPVYSYQIISGNIPTKAAMAGKKEDNWMQIDETFQYKFSLYRNEFVRIEFNDGKIKTGYFDSFNRANERLRIIHHSNPIRKDNDKKNKGEEISIKSKVINIDKYYVDVLGRRYKTKK